MAAAFMDARSWLPRSVYAPGVVGTVATLGVVAAGAAIVEAALVPGLLLGGAAVLAPRLLPRHMLSGWSDRLRRTAPSPVRAAPTSQPEEASAAGEAEPFDVWHAALKTITYRVLVTAADFGANYVVIGELATAAGLSSLSLAAGPIAYFAHEAVWHYYGPALARSSDPREAAVHVSIPGAAESDDPGHPRLVGVKVSRALAKTATYEVVTGVSEFSVNYLFVRDLAAAAGLTTFSIVISPFVYYVHEKAWDYFDARKARARIAQAVKLLPAA